MVTKENLKSALNKLELKIDYKLQSLEFALILKLGGLMAAFLATGLTAAKLLFI